MSKEKTYHLFSSEDSPFSNFYPSKFEYAGIKFPTAEHAIMYHKAKMFGADDIAQKILECEKPADTKQLGREIKNYDDSMWAITRDFVVLSVLIAKFSQNEELKKLLSDTEADLFVYANPNDKLWGVGFSAEDCVKYPESEWPGTNLLGNIITQIKYFFLKK